VVTPAAALGRAFLRRLVGFHDSPFDYVLPRLFGRFGTITVDPAAYVVELQPPPLLIVLQLAGLSDGAVVLPWLDRPVIVHHGGTR
jgi:hypothetical protein